MVGLSLELIYVFASDFEILAFSVLSKGLMSTLSEEEESTNENRYRGYY